MPSSSDRTLAAYRALEGLLDRGDVCAIGVSNFGIRHLEALAAKVEVIRNRDSGSGGVGGELFRRGQHCDRRSR